MLNNETWALQLEAELKKNILGFWLKHSYDQQYGGFLGEVQRNLTVVEDASKSAVLNTRLLWTFSTAFRVYKDEQYLTAANRAFHYLNTYFIDRKYGGVFWMLNADGTPLDKRKQIYAQAFAIYAYSEYYRATGNDDALALALQIYTLVEKHGIDLNYGGYLEARAEDWQETTLFSLSDKDLNEAKSMNTHLHVLEAYTNLYRVWPTAELAARLENLIVVIIDHIVDEQTGHFKLFFDNSWNSKSAHVSYGHDIEGSWLLVEAIEVLEHTLHDSLGSLHKRVNDIAIKMADAVLANGVDIDGGILNEAEHNIIIDDHKDWWPQAEAMVGFYNAYQMTKHEKYKVAALNCWTFINQFIIDHKYGEWHWSVQRNGKPSDNQQKISAWKCPYHNGRACFEMLERLR